MYKPCPDFRKEASVLEVTDPDGKLLEVGMVMCCHCGGHFEKKPGSGNVRGFCTNCNGHVCGVNCQAGCDPIEKKLDRMDSGLSPTAVTVGAGRDAEKVPSIWLPPGA